MVTKRELLEISLNSLRIVGLHPNQKFVYASVVICSNFLRIIFIYLLIRLVTETQSDLSFLMDVVEALAIYVQSISKMLPVLMHRKRLRILIGDINVLGHKNINVPNFSFWLSTLKFYRAAFFIAAIGFLTLSAVTKTTTATCYIPDYPYALPMLITCQDVLLVLDATCVFGVDALFFSVCFIIKQNFIELGEDCAGINKEMDITRLKLRYIKCVKDHDALLSYSAHLVDAFSMSLLIQYLVTTFTIFNILLALTESTGIQFMRGLIMIALVLPQLSANCFLAEEVTQSTFQVCNFANNLDWYNHPKTLQNFIPLIIQRSQKPVQFMGGGLILMNREAITNIVKRSFSFYTLIKHLKDQ